MTDSPKKLKLADVSFIVLGERVWGKGDTLTDALANMRKNGSSSKYVAFVVHPDSNVNIMGNIGFPVGFPPKEVHRVGIKAKKK
jgi:hypothetical protein